MEICNSKPEYVSSHQMICMNWSGGEGGEGRGLDIYARTLTGNSCVWVESTSPVLTAKTPLATRCSSPLTKHSLPVQRGPARAKWLIRNLISSARGEVSNVRSGVLQGSRWVATKTKSGFIPLKLGLQECYCIMFHCHYHHKAIGSSIQHSFTFL